MIVLRVRQKANPVEAVEWNENSKDEVLGWLSAHGMGYTFHEIASAGQLIIYTDEGPIQIPFDYWIIRHGSNDYTVCSKQSFDAFYEVVEDVESMEKEAETA